MAKLKVKNSEERLILTGDEIRVVAALIEKVRLGHGCHLREAAASILRELEKSKFADDCGSYEHYVDIFHTIEQHAYVLDVTYELNEHNPYL